MSKGTWIVFAVLLTAGCGGSDGAGTPSGPVAEVSFQATPGQAATGNITAYDGCHYTGAEYTTDGVNLVVEEPWITPNGCDPRRSHCSGFDDTSAECQAAREVADRAQDQFTRRLLSYESRYQIEGDTLTLLDADGTVLLDLTRSG